MPDRPVPVIAGAAQVVQRLAPEQLAGARGPIELMADAAVAAGADSGRPALLRRAGWVGVAGGYFRHTNPGRLVADQLGAAGAATALSGVSGTAPQDMVSLAAARIAAGQLDVALVLGGEARWSHQRLSRAGLEPSWITEPGTGEPETLSALPPEMIDEFRQLGAPAAAYALFEDRLRVAAGRTVGEHRDHIAGLWARFSAVAATNPYAWDRTAHEASEIAEPGPANRMIAFPYTKAMVANNTVDMASALLICSLETALAAGVDRDRLVFPHTATSAHETWTVLQRGRLDRTPALAAAGRQALAMAGWAVDEVEHLDLYSCFPSIVEMSTEALGLDPERQLTLTGGLGFAGAAIANAVGHSLAAMVATVRERGGRALVHANGGTATKHAVGLYAGTPPDQFRYLDCQDLVGGRPRAPLPDGTEGPVEVEAATVLHGREGPARALATVVDADGRRGFATTDDRAVMAAVESEGVAGALARLGPDGRLEV